MLSIYLHILAKQLNRGHFHSIPSNHLIDTFKASAMATSSISVTNLVFDSILDMVVFSKLTPLTSKRLNKSICVTLGLDFNLASFRQLPIYRDLDHYRGWQTNSNVDKHIILTHLNDGARARVFSQKTQGKNYHHYMLAISCLIKSRFKDAAILYGDFDNGQVEISVQWANNILDRPIDLPTLVNYDQLWGQLKR